MDTSTLIRGEIERAVPSPASRRYGNLYDLLRALKESREYGFARGREGELHRLAIIEMGKIGTPYVFMHHGTIAVLAGTEVCRRVEFADIAYASDRVIRASLRADGGGAI